MGGCSFYVLNIPYPTTGRKGELLFIPRNLQSNKADRQQVQPVIRGYMPGWQQATVSARELHKEVGSTERFSAWFERQLQYGFVENEDYIGCKKFNTFAKQELQDYDLTVDMAKHICIYSRDADGARITGYKQDHRQQELRWNVATCGNNGDGSGDGGKPVHISSGFLRSFSSKAGKAPKPRAAHT